MREFLFEDVEKSFTPEEDIRVFFPKRKQPFVWAWRQLNANI